MALHKPAPTYEGVCHDLRSAIGASLRAREVQQFNQIDINEENDFRQHWTDRIYGGRNVPRKPPQTQAKYTNNYHRNPRESHTKNSQASATRQKRCYCCGKINCWSSKHSIAERRQAFDKFKQGQFVGDTEITPAYFNNFLTKYEGVEGLERDDETEEIQQLLMEMELENDACDIFFSEFGEINGTKTITALKDQAVFHAVTKTDIFNELIENSTFTFDDRYSSDTFHGIMPDSGAAGISTAGKNQFLALKRMDSTIKLDKSTAGQHKIRFGKGMAISQGTVDVPTPLGVITFHIVPANTPFLFCIQDMDKMNVKLDNLKNVLIQGDTIVPVVRKWGHPWMLLHQLEQSIAWSHLTESELRQLHRRFGHPSVQRLHKVLQRAGHNVKSSAIKELTKKCHQCQMNAKAPSRFKFTLREDYCQDCLLCIIYIWR